MSFRRLWTRIGGGDGQSTVASGAASVAFEQNYFDDDVNKYMDPDAERLQQILYEVNYAVGPSHRRCESLSLLAKELEHDDERRHDNELAENVDLILYQKLALCLAIDPSSAEVILIASILERLYDGAGRPAVSASFANIGMAVLPVLMEVVGGLRPLRTEDEEKEEEEEEEEDNENNKEEEKEVLAEEEERKDDDVEDDGRESLGVSPPAPTSDSPDQYPPDAEHNNENNEEEKDDDNNNNKEETEEKESDTDEPVANPGDIEVDWVRPEEEEDPNNDASTLPSTQYSHHSNSRSHSSAREPSLEAVAKMLRVLRYYSRVLSAGVHLARHPGLLSALLDLIDGNLSENGDDDHNNEEAAADLRVDATAVLVNLACAEDNKILMTKHPRLLDVVVRRTQKDGRPKVREHCHVILMNLSLADRNGPRMAGHDGVLTALTDTVNGGDDRDDDTPYARKYAAATLFRLAPVVMSVAVDGGNSDRLFEALRTVLAKDPSDPARVAAAEVLYAAAEDHERKDDEDDGNDGNDHPLADRPRVLETLANAVVTDYNADVRANAARALGRTASDVHFSEKRRKRHRALLDALVRASAWTKTDAIAVALMNQATKSRNRLAMAECPGLLDVLGTLCENPSTKDAALVAVERMCAEEAARPVMARNEAIVTALTKETFKEDERVVEGVGDDDDVSYADSMKTALKNLTEHI